MTERKPDPPPLETDDVRTVQVGTALWALALVVSLCFYAPLRDGHHLWWLWACGCGVALGFLGVYYCKRRAAAIARDRAAGG